MDEIKEEPLDEVFSTIQVSNLDVSMTTVQLEELFGEHGPLKRCFVVKPRKGPAKITTGIVQFALAEDADKAAQDGTIQYEFMTKQG